MPVTITFHKISEKKPNHGDAIIYLKKISPMGFTGFEPCECNTEYCWLGVNDDGSFRLGVIFGNEEAEDESLWISVEDYWACFTEDEDNNGRSTNN